MFLFICNHLEIGTTIDGIGLAKLRFHRIVRVILVFLTGRGSEFYLILIGNLEGTCRHGLARLQVAIGRPNFFIFLSA